MPYAINGQVSTSPIEGGVEISDEQYLEAVDGMCSGLVVTIDGGFSVSAPEIPEPQPVVPPTSEELRSAALGQRDGLLAVATLRINPLQDAVDIDDATEGDVAMLKKWKQYRVALSRIEQVEGFPRDIAWPISPDA